MSQVREKFATQVKPEIMTAIRELAGKEGRPLQSLVDEAFSDLIEKRKKTAPRPRVVRTYLSSHEKYGPLYKKLAE